MQFSIKMNDYDIMESTYTIVHHASLASQKRIIPLPRGIPKQITWKNGAF
jgi:hypothetical protein